MSHLFCPCGRCPIRPMREGHVPECLADEGDEFTMLALLGDQLHRPTLPRQGRTKALARTCRQQGGRPADPADEWRAWLASRIEKVPHESSRLEAMASVASTATSWLTV